ncbi:MAG: PIG-L family deacetylase [Armatimonadetes bacterium]|nr:PIG-L family deacetylase [Armatimonadota bacterium]
MVSRVRWRWILALAIVVGLSLRVSEPVRPPSAGTPAAVTAADDHYRFLPGAGEEQGVVLSPTATGVRWNWARPAAAGWHTALIAVRSTGGEVEPWVELCAGSARIQQYLDPHAAGLRWLNLTGLREQLSDGVAVEIQAHGVRIEPGPATLRIFTDRPDLNSRILVLAPHPDDAEIAAFGLYAGRDTTIVTVTSGNAGDFNYRENVGEPAEHYQLKGYLRTVDSVTVPWQGQVPPEHCFNLGYFDARLQAMRDKPEEPVSEMYGPNQDVSVYRRANIGRLLDAGPRTATWAHLVEDLAEVLRRVKPAIVVMPHPFLDFHRDHQLVAVAAVEALESWNEPATFLLYTNHAAENRYPFGPAGTVVSLPPWSGPELPVDGLYAHPVDLELQRRKLFALESMHDLRLSPAEQSSPGRERRPDYPRVPEVDYFRRAVRSEEVFFVFSREGVRELLRSFLTQDPHFTK